MTDMQVRIFVSAVEMALPRFREADALLDGGEPLDDALRAFVADLGPQLDGDACEEARDWLGRPERELLDGKLATLRAQWARIEPEL